MAKTTRALSGAAKDLYLRHAIESEAGLDAGIANRLVGTLQSGVAQLRVRIDGARGIASPSAVAAHETAETEPFDPFAPNVIVLLRTQGRDAVLAALEQITSAENLRLLAREQQLSIGGEAQSEGALRLAIVAAAERRVANRKAAAG